MTTETTLTRDDTGEFLPVRVTTPGVHVSAPYSRAVGILDKWVRAERKAADELSAWIEGQTAQAAAEMRSDADEQQHQHRQFRLEMAERNRREGTVNLPPAFEEIATAPVKWAEVEVHPTSVIPAEPDPVQAYMDADDTDERPGRAVVLAPRYDPVLAAQAREGLSRQARRFVPRREDYGPHPALEPTLEGTYARPVGAIDWRAEWAEFVGDLGRPLRSLRAWWRAKQAQRDERMGVEE